MNPFLAIDTHSCSVFIASLFPRDVSRTLVRDKAEDCLHFSCAHGFLTYLVLRFRVGACLLYLRAHIYFTVRYVSCPFRL